MNRTYRWLVVICREGETEATGFEEEQAARDFFDRASWKWTESFLCEVVIGPGTNGLYRRDDQCRIDSISRSENSSSQ